MGGPTANPEGCPDRVRLYHSGTGQRLRLPCGRRLCSWCGPNVWRKRVLAGLHAGLRAAPPDQYLAILLTAPGTSDPEVFNREASERFERWVEYMRREVGPFGYWRVAELQQRGHVHYHIVTRGLRWVDIGKLRRAARWAGFGSWVGVRRPTAYKGGVRSLGWYFTKYLLKDTGLRARGVSKLVTFSNGWRAGWRRMRRPSVRGRWLYAGTARQGWSALGVWRERQGDSPSASGPPDWHPWMGRSWQAARAAEERPIDMGL